MAYRACLTRSEKPALCWVATDSESWGERLPIACGMSTGSFSRVLVVSATPLTVCLFYWSFVSLIKCIHTALPSYMLIALLFVWDVPCLLYCIAYTNQGVCLSSTLGVCMTSCCHARYGMCASAHLETSIWEIYQEILVYDAQRAIFWIDITLLQSPEAVYIIPHS